MIHFKMHCASLKGHLIICRQTTQVYGAVIYTEVGRENHTHVLNETESYWTVIATLKNYPSFCRELNATTTFIFIMYFIITHNLDFVQSLFICRFIYIIMNVLIIPLSLSPPWQKTLSPMGKEIYKTCITVSCHVKQHTVDLYQLPCSVTGGVT